MAKVKKFFPTIEQVGADYVCDLPANSVIPNYGMISALPMRSFTSGENPIGLGSLSLASLPNLKKVHIKSVSSNTGISSNAFYGSKVEEFIVDSSNNATTNTCHGATISWSYQNTVAFGLDRISLKKLIFPFNGTLSPFAFMGCENLEEISPFTENTKFNTQGFPAFKGCKSLKRIDLTRFVGDLTGHDFEGCTSLEEIGDTSGVNSIANASFSETNITEAVFPNATKIDGNAFRRCSSLERTGDFNFVTQIGSSGGNVFNECPNLKRIGQFNSLVNILGLDILRNVKAEQYYNFPALVSSVEAGLRDNASKAFLVPKLTGCTNNIGQVFAGCIKCEYVGPFTDDKTTFEYFIVMFAGIGNDVPTRNDIDGNVFKCIIEFQALTCTELMTGAMFKGGSFPYAAPTSTKFVCSDGYIVNANNQWVIHLYSEGATREDYYAEYLAKWEEQEREYHSEA